MAYTTAQRRHSELWALVARQHGVVSRAQLLALGYSPQAITHRLARGRLHHVRRGVYALGRPELTRHGRWMAATLGAGADVALSHESAAALWGFRDAEPGVIELSIPHGRSARRAGTVVHRRPSLGPADVTRHRGIPVTTPTCTLIDLAARLERNRLERAVDEADKLGLTDPEALRSALDQVDPRPGVRALREALDRATFVLAESELERRFLALVRASGLPPPLAGQRVCGFKVDFRWPPLGLVVETDGLRYHRTPAQQARDRRRDQALAAAGLTCLRFTHAQVAFEPEAVRRTLEAIAQLRAYSDSKTSA